MKKNTKRIIIYSLYGVICITFLTSVLFVKKYMNKQINNSNLNVEIKPVNNTKIDDKVVPVFNDDNLISKPFNGDINASINFYNSKEEIENQENSLIYYENTYMKSTGTYYKSDKELDVLSIYDGKVTEIKEDNLLGNVVRIDYGNNTIGVYECIDSIKVKVGDTISKGDVIGKFSTCKVFSEDNGLYFELIHNGININPELYYFKKLEELD